MRRSILQRGSIVALLVGRLIFGELAHAVPHEEPSHGEAATPVAQHEQPCPGHQESQPGERSDHDSTAYAVVADDGSDKDCCNGDACKCPCPHASAFAMFVQPAHTQRLDSPSFETFVAAARNRVSGLFRPPA